MMEKPKIPIFVITIVMTISILGLVGTFVIEYFAKQKNPAAQKPASEQQFQEFEERYLASLEDQKKQEAEILKLKEEGASYRKLIRTLNRAKREGGSEGAGDQLTSPSEDLLLAAQDEIIALKDQLKQFEATQANISNTQEKLLAVQEQLDQQDKVALEATAQNKELSTKNEEQAKKILKLEEELEATRLGDQSSEEGVAAAIQAKEEKILELEEELKVSQSTYEEYQKTVEAQDQEVQAKIEELEKELVQIRSEPKESVTESSENQDLLNEISELQTALAALQATHDQYKLDAEAKLQEASGVQAAEGSAEMQSLKEKIEQQDAKLKETETNFKNAQTKVDVKTKRVAELEAEVEDLRVQILKPETSELETQFEEAKKEVEQLNSEVNTLREENEALRQNTEPAEDAIDPNPELQATINQLRGELEALKMGQGEGEMAALPTEDSAALAELQETKDALNRSTKELEALKEKLAQLEKQRSGAVETTVLPPAADEDLFKQANAKIEQLQEKVDEYELMLKDQKSALMGQIETLKRELKRKEDEGLVEGTYEARDEIKRQGVLPSREAEVISELKSQIEELKFKNEELSAAVLRWQDKAENYDYQLLQKEKEFRKRVMEHNKKVAYKLDSRNKYHKSRMKEVENQMLMKMEEQVKDHQMTMENLRLEMMEVEHERTRQFQLETQHMTMDLISVRGDLDATMDQLKSREDELIRVEGEKQALLDEVRRIGELEAQIRFQQNEVLNREEQIEIITAKSEAQLNELDAKRQAELKTLSEEKKKAVQSYEALDYQFSELQSAHLKDRVTFFYNMGLAYTYSGLYGDAVNMYLKALELNPNDAPTHYNLGILYEEHMDKIEEAVKHYKSYIALEKDEEKRDRVRVWVHMAGRKFGSGRTTPPESAKKAFSGLFLT